MASTFRTAAGLGMASEQPQPGCSGRLQFEFLGGLRGGSAAGVRTAAAPEKHMRIVRIKGDGRCLFRAMVRFTRQEWHCSDLRTAGCWQASPTLILWVALRVLSSVLPLSMPVSRSSLLKALGV